MEAISPKPPRYRTPWMLIVFVAALAITVGAAYISYSFGQRALRDVTTPTSITVAGLKGARSTGFIQEMQVLTQVAQLELRLREQGLTQVSLTDIDPELQSEVDLTKSDIFEEPEIVPADPQPYPTQQVSNGSVNLSVTDIYRLNNNLILDLTLSNQGSDDRRFLYGDAFNQLVISDETGRRLSTFTTGLPGDLPANGEVYAGSIEIPLDEVQSARYLRINLRDYPDQAVDLLLGSVAVPR